MNELADKIIELAKQDFENDKCCQGGLKSKIHGVFMDLALELAERMERGRSC